MTPTEIKKVLKVLTVDDSNLFVNHISNLLNSVKNVQWIGHAFSISEAYRFINNNRPNVILLDIHLKGETGLGLLIFLREKFKDIKVVMLTNSSNAAYRKKCIELGASYFLDKSTEFEKIPETIELISNSLQN